MYGIGGTKAKRTPGLEDQNSATMLHKGFFPFVFNNSVSSKWTLSQRSPWLFQGLF